MTRVDPGICVEHNYFLHDFFWISPKILKNQKNEPFTVNFIFQSDVQSTSRYTKHNKRRDLIFIMQHCYTL